jgi:hypothetical protein
MDPTRILLPMAALVGLTFVVVAQVPYRRFRAAFRGEVTADDFAYGESARVPSEVSIPNRNLMNLLEMPVLFYVQCLALYVTRSVDATALAMAWGYVGLRVCHSAVHLTYNHVGHRALAYGASVVLLAALWLRFVAHLLYY